jgi:RNA polymerase sigma factor (sigma-70 family)
MTEEGPAPAPLNDLAARAAGGDRAALDAFVRAVQHDIYGLSLRMLWHPEDAADAAQEILIKIVTHLGTFRGDSDIRTWCFRVASNHLLNVRASRAERRARTFEQLATSLEAAPEEPAADARSSPEARLLEQEVRVGCTLGILLCLDRPHRLAFVLGEVLGLSGEEAAAISEVPGPTYRKRLSRAREQMREFVGAHCGIVNAEAPCRCSKQVASGIASGRVRPQKLLFSGQPERPFSERTLFAKARELEELNATVALYRAHPDFEAPESMTAFLRDLLATRGPSVLSEEGIE